jgi:hypothetical protein
MDSARRIKYSLMLLILVGAALAMLASTQNWYRIVLVPSADHTAVVTMQGSSAAPALTALALAGIALAAALSIAGRIARIVLGLLGALVGICILVSTASALSDPVAAAGSAITSATGVAGSTSIAHLVQSLQVEFWAWLAVAGGVIVVVAGIAVPITNRRWPDASRRFETAPAESADSRAGVAGAEAGATGTSSAAASRRSPRPPESARDLAIDSWDELTRGTDPTEQGGVASGGADRDDS